MSVGIGGDAASARGADADPGTASSRSLAPPTQRLVVPRRTLYRDPASGKTYFTAEEVRAAQKMAASQPPRARGTGLRETTLVLTNLLPSDLAMR